MTFEQRIKGSKEVLRTDTYRILGRRNSVHNSPDAWCDPETAEKPVWLEQRARWTVDGNEVRKAMLSTGLSSASFYSW